MRHLRVVKIIKTKNGTVGTMDWSTEGELPFNKH